MTDNGKISAVIFRATHSELKVLCATLGIRYQKQDSKEILRDKLLKAAGFKDEQQARTTIKSYHLSDDEREAIARAAITNEIELLKAAASMLTGLLNHPMQSVDWLANAAAHEIRYAHGKTHIAKLVTLTKKEEPIA